jgi:hypothetical protein
LVLSLIRGTIYTPEVISLEFGYECLSTKETHPKSTGLSRSIMASFVLASTVSAKKERRTKAEILRKNDMMSEVMFVYAPYFLGLTT